jgi:hypothetical protein
MPDLRLFVGPARVRPVAGRRVTLHGTQVKAMTAFVTPEIFPRFGLPETLSQLHKRTPHCRT